jgi:hypothetical protein
MEASVWNVNPFDRRVPGGIRTPNLLIRSQLLYPVELQTPLVVDFRFSIVDFRLARQEDFRAAPKELELSEGTCSKTLGELIE